ncbi:MAG: hypothetical protein AAFY67_22445 [Cyanobacteria bacterium J06642_9]
MVRLKIIEKYDSSFTLAPEVKATLFDLLMSDTFQQQVCQHTGFDRVEFTQLLFQPTPYTPETPLGMPKPFEVYHASADHVIVNVPPNFMFKAKAFNPNRLCAIYRRIGSAVSQSVDAE